MRKGIQSKGDPNIKQTAAFPVLLGHCQSNIEDQEDACGFVTDMRSIWCNNTFVLSYIPE